MYFKIILGLGIESWQGRDLPHTHPDRLWGPPTSCTIDVTWLVTLGRGGGQNRPWVLSNLIYKVVKLKRRGRSV